MTLARQDQNSKPEWAAVDTALFTKNKTQIRKYDAFFQDTHKFNRTGISGIACTTSFVDPAGRAVATWASNATWTKTVYNAWSEVVYDAGDVVLVDDPFRDVDAGLYLSGLPAHERSSKTWYLSLVHSGRTSDVQRAEASQVYANTPSTIIYDALGQKYCTTVHNGAHGRFKSRVFRNINGWTTKVQDSLERTVTLNTFDMLGNVLHSASMDTGESWTLKDATSMPIRTRNSRGIEQHLSYDALGRQTDIWLTTPGAAPVMVQKTVYGEAQPDAARFNLRGKVYQVCDQAQRLTTEAYDHLGNPLRGTQSLVQEYKAVVDWAAPGGVALEPETFTWSATHDALGRLLTRTRADGSVVTHTWNLRGLPESTTSRESAAEDIAAIQSITYNARGQKTIMDLGNGVRCVYGYDPETASLLSKKTITAKGEVVQDLHYTVDCMKRKVLIEDDAQQTIFFRGAVVDASRQLLYDAMGRLVAASGREHLGQLGQNWVSIPASNTAASLATASPSDGQAMCRYTEQYTYDSEGNMTSLTHSLADKGVVGWTRRFVYNEPSFLEPGKRNNRLSESSVGDTTSSLRYLGPDGQAGLVTDMTGFSRMSWDYANRLQASAKQVVANGGTPETTWYRYDSNNRRVRKVTEGYAAKGNSPVKRKDHLYIHDAEVEIFRRWGFNSSSPTLERWSWHVRTADGKARVVLIEASKDINSGTFQDAVRLFQVQDSAASVGIELDEQGAVVSYEEYAPYGTTTYRASTNPQQPKRYRFASKERDSESGLDYVENRYYVSWLARWLSPDPLGTADGLNVFLYVGCDPVNKTDPSGLTGSKKEEETAPPEIYLHVEVMISILQFALDASNNEPPGAQLQLLDAFSRVSRTWEQASRSARLAAYWTILDIRCLMLPQQMFNHSTSWLTKRNMNYVFPQLNVFHVAQAGRIRDGRAMILDMITNQINRSNVSSGVLKKLWRWYGMSLNQSQPVQDSLSKAKLQLTVITVERRREIRKAQQARRTG